jgi:plastocyanin
MPIRTSRTCWLALASAVVLPLPAFAAQANPTVRDASGAAAGAYSPHFKRHARHLHWRAVHGGRAAVRRHAVRLHAAGVTIADFQFTPATTTIHVGDTITWTNDGPSDHTSTADDGTFDSAVLHKGQSASHTFTQAGTITYHCRIHPFMKGTVVVLTTASGAAAGASAGSGAGSGASGNSTSKAGTSGPTLPFTGLDTGAGLSLGLLLLGSGLGLRRAVRG